MGAAFLVSGLEQYSAGQLRQRGSSPKLVFWNNALINAVSGLTQRATLEDGAWYGRIVENAVGAHLLNSLQGTEWSITYWRDGDKEVDFVVQRGKRTWGLEVKSGRTGKLSGLDAFRRRYPDAQTWVIGAEYVSLEDFFVRNPLSFFE
jgi:predicted AAA+ superfamily ATPase